VNVNHIIVHMIYEFVQAIAPLCGDRVVALCRS